MITYQNKLWVTLLFIFFLGCEDDNRTSLSNQDQDMTAMMRISDQGSLKLDQGSLELDQGSLELDQGSLNPDQAILDPDQAILDPDQEMLELDAQIESSDALLEMGTQLDADMIDASLIDASLEPECEIPSPEIEDELDNDCDERIDEGLILSSDWITITSGSFQMGTATELRESPVHEVTVPSFQIMRAEVTVAQYRRCVEENVCSPPVMGDALNWTQMRGAEDHPINGVSWLQMNTFAQWVSLRWVGARLPTEAEWEYAAKSQGQEIIFPWGDEMPDCDYAQYRGPEGESCLLGGTGPVCSTPRGNTTQGLCDMAGNVYEWVQDEWHDNYEGAPQDGSAWCSLEGCAHNSAAMRVVRGGAWSSAAQYIRAARRGQNATQDQVHSVGARLVRSIP